MVADTVRTLREKFSGGAPIDYLLVNIESGWYELPRHGGWTRNVRSLKVEIRMRYDERCHRYGPSATGRGSSDSPGEPLPSASACDARRCGRCSGSTPRRSRSRTSAPGTGPTPPAGRPKRPATPRLRAVGGNPPDRHGAAHFVTRIDRPTIFRATLAGAYGGWEECNLGPRPTDTPS